MYCLLVLTHCVECSNGVAVEIETIWLPCGVMYTIDWARYSYWKMESHTPTEEIEQASAALDLNEEVTEYEPGTSSVQPQNRSAADNLSLQLIDIPTMVPKLLITPTSPEAISSPTLSPNMLQVPNNTPCNDLSHQFNIPVIGYEVMEERARFTVYKMKIENSDIPGDSWLIYRRYTDFARLHAKLHEECPTIKLALPPKRWLKDNFDAIFIEDRLQGLQIFVDSILKQRELLYLNTVREFFCLDEPPTYPENIEETRAAFEMLEETVLQLRHQLHEKEIENAMLRATLGMERLDNNDTSLNMNGLYHDPHLTSPSLRGSPATLSTCHVSTSTPLKSAQSSSRYNTSRDSPKRIIFSDINASEL